MKKIILLVLVAVGLGFVAKAQTEYLVTVDPATGAFTKVNSIPGVYWIDISPSYNTIDGANNSFIFAGAPIDHTPSYLYSLNETNGDMISNPIFSAPIECVVYGKSSNILYGLQKQNNFEYLVSVDVTTGATTTINTFNNDIITSGGMTYNNNLNQLIIYGEDSNENWAFFMVDGNTGDIISETISTNNYSLLQFDNTTNQLFTLQENYSSTTFQLGTINIATGAFSSIYAIPAGERLQYPSTFDEKDQEYIIPIADASGNWYLYFINVSTGKVVYTDPVEADGNSDNVVEYTYDNSNNILYALHWEALTTPVTLLSFTASKQGAQNLLRWATTQEINSNYFVVERSGDGVNFTSIGLVSAAGNSSVSNSYSLVDAKPVSGMNYYRLKIVDKDGKFTYSQVRSINEAVSFWASIYPNPVVNNLSLNISSDKAMEVEVLVVDNDGRIVVTQQMAVGSGISAKSVNVSSLSSGEYYVRIVSSEGEMEERFVKAR